MASSNRDILDNILSALGKPNTPLYPILLEIIDKDLSKRGKELSKKHKRLFAASNYVNGLILLTPEEAQELVDDIEQVNNVNEDDTPIEAAQAIVYKRVQENRLNRKPIKHTINSDWNPCEHCQQSTSLTKK